MRVCVRAGACTHTSKLCSLLSHLLLSTHPLQSGFCPHLSTDTALLSTTSDLFDAKHAGDCSVLLSLEPCSPFKAVDTVSSKRVLHLASVTPSTLGSPSTSLLTAPHSFLTDFLFLPSSLFQCFSEFCPNPPSGLTPRSPK